MFSYPIITLTTDFGLQDAYVAVMKGVILALAPRAVMIDVSHEVEPQNVTQAAYLLTSVWSYFPPDTIHLAVVDPGVGTRRRALAVRTPHGVFVGPDNGIFYPSLVAQAAVQNSTGKLVEGRAVELTNDRYHRRPVSNTFHGRDIFAPAAGHLAAGVDLQELGPRVEKITASAHVLPRIEPGTTFGHVTSIDRFGNVITNLTPEALPVHPCIAAGGITITGLSHSYQDGEVVALVGSMGVVEIAVRNGNAAERLRIGVGDSVVARSDSCDF